MTFTTVDIFCNIIDNFGDIGVVYRFARELKKAMPHIIIRVFIDDLSCFQILKSEIDTNSTVQEHDAITYIDSNKINSDLIETLGVAEIIIESFACIIPSLYMEKAYIESILLINLEHLCAESWVEEYHLKESLLPKGTLKKYYFMPGFTTRTGGLIIDNIAPNIIPRGENRLSFINSLLSECKPIDTCITEVLIGTVFTYTRGLEYFIRDCISLHKPMYILIFGEKSIKSIKYAMQSFSFQYRDNKSFEIDTVTFIEMPFVSQTLYDVMLHLADFNIVRGEDSLSRAILAKKPFIWNAYIQDNCYQTIKVNALCQMMRQWFNDLTDYEAYKDLMIKFNSAPIESVQQVTHESYVLFFDNLKKNEHTITEISYFMELNCCLMKNLTAFIRDYPHANNDCT